MPRASGDSPHQRCDVHHRVGFAPRKWGFTSTRARTRKNGKVCPAQVGIHRRSGATGRSERCLPRASGDLPDQGDAQGHSRSFAPRKWGFTVTDLDALLKQKVCPAQVGIHRNARFEKSLFAVSSGSSGKIEPQRSSFEERGNSQVAEAPKASGHPFGQLDQPVDCFDGAVGDPALEKGDDCPPRSHWMVSESLRKRASRLRSAHRHQPLRSSRREEIRGRRRSWQGKGRWKAASLPRSIRLRSASTEPVLWTRRPCVSLTSGSLPRSGHSQAVFGHHLNIRKDAVGKWERGGRRPDGSLPKHHLI